MLSLLWLPDPPSSSISYPVQEGRSGTRTNDSHQLSQEDQFHCPCHFCCYITCTSLKMMAWENFFSTLCMISHLLHSLCIQCAIFLPNQWQSASASQWLPATWSLQSDWRCTYSCSCYGKLTIVTRLLFHMGNSLVHETRGMLGLL